MLRVLEAPRQARWAWRSLSHRSGTTRKRSTEMICYLKKHLSELVKRRRAEYTPKVICYLRKHLSEFLKIRAEGSPRHARACTLLRAPASTSSGT